MCQTGFSVLTDQKESGSVPEPRYFFLILSKVHAHICDSAIYLFNNINYIEYIHINSYNKLTLSLIIHY